MRRTVYDMVKNVNNLSHISCARAQSGENKHSSDELTPKCAHLLVRREPLDKVCRDLSRYHPGLPQQEMIRTSHILVFVLLLIPFHHLLAFWCSLRQILSVAAVSQADPRSLGSTVNRSEFDSHSPGEMRDAFFRRHTQFVGFLALWSFALWASNCLPIVSPSNIELSVMCTFFTLSGVCGHTGLLTSPGDLQV